MVRFDRALPIAFGLVCVASCGGNSGNRGSEGEGTGLEATGADDESGEASAEGTAGETEAGEGADIKFDLGVIPDGGGSCAGGGGGDPDFSFLWAANSTQGTISKLDTQTVQEVGRYVVRPDSAGSPSRTSVSLSGHVAVANRNGGVTKIYATQDQCQESNGMPGIQTSSGNTALPWGQEECMAWHTPFNYSTQRPVAWVQGVWNNGTCQYEQERLWTSGKTAGAQTIDVVLMDGDDGSIIDQVAISGLVNDSYGIYGGAVDGDGNFWGSQLGTANKLVRVDIDDLSYQIWDAPSGPWWYGMTVDSDAYVWLCSGTAGRFDPQTETWQTAVVGGYTGCMADAGPNGLLWMSTGQGVVGVNRETLLVERNWPTTGSYGISIDFYGYVWAVAFGSSAHRIDPDTGAVQSYSGLIGAYTYSDMTGYALSNAGTPSG